MGAPPTDQPSIWRHSYFSCSIIKPLQNKAQRPCRHVSTAAFGRHVDVCCERTPFVLFFSSETRNQREARENQSSFWTIHILFGYKARALVCTERRTVHWQSNGPGFFQTWGASPAAAVSYGQLVWGSHFPYQGNPLSIKTDGRQQITILGEPEVIWS